MQKDKTAGRPADPTSPARRTSAEDQARTGTPILWCRSLRLCGKHQEYPCDSAAKHSEFLRQNGRVRLLPVLRGLRTFFQCLAIPDPSFASVAGKFEILRKFERIHGTRIFAKPAEQAAA